MAEGTIFHKFSINCNWHCGTFADTKKNVGTSLVFCCWWGFLIGAIPPENLKGKLKNQCFEIALELARNWCRWPRIMDYRPVFKHKIPLNEPKWCNFHTVDMSDTTHTNRKKWTIGIHLHLALHIGLWLMAYYSLDNGYAHNVSVRFLHFDSNK